MAGGLAYGTHVLSRCFRKLSRCTRAKRSTCRLAITRATHRLVNFLGDFTRVAAESASYTRAYAKEANFPVLGFYRPG